MAYEHVIADRLDQIALNTKEIAAALKHEQYHEEYEQYHEEIKNAHASAIEFIHALQRDMQNVARRDEHTPKTDLAYAIDNKIEAWKELRTSISIPSRKGT